MRRLIFLAALMVFSTTGANAAALTLACLDVGRVVEACQANAAAFEAETGHTVRVVAAAPGERVALEQYRALFSIESPRVDVIQFPDGWIPALADDLTPLGTLDDPEAFVPAAERGGQHNGQRVGLPQHLATTVLFVRSDVVGSDAEFWSGLRERLITAPKDGATRLVLGGADPTLFSFFLDWFYGSGGSSLEDRESVHQALTLLADFLGPVGAPGLAQMPQRDATQAFTGGSSAAMIARSTQLSSVTRSDIAEQVIKQRLPRFKSGPENAAVLLTTWYVGVSRFSAEPDAARALADYLVSPAVERQNAIDYALAPTRLDVYHDPAVQQARPFLDKLGGLSDRFSGPPTQAFGTAYLSLTDSVADAVRALLRGETDVDRATGAIVRAARRANKLATN